jgi:F-type H+-transporting ATPase subunit a
MLIENVPFMLAAGDPQGHVVDYAILKAGNWWLLTNHMVMMLTAAVIMLLVFPAVTRRYQSGEMVPTGSRNFIEALMMFIRNDVAKPLLGDDTDRYMPLLWTLFFFILICNLLGLLPFDAIQNAVFGQAVVNFHPIYGTATSNFYVTATLALVVFVVIQASGIKSNGVGGWLHHFLGGAPAWLAPVMLPVEFLGMIIKPFALAVRLAANMTAGHILLAVLIGFVPQAIHAAGTGAGVGVGIVSVVASTLIMLLELFVACLQAYLFTFLSSLFISQMLVHHHEGEDEAHKHDHGDELGEPVSVREGSAGVVHNAVKPAH